jgi:hypothetical protein
MSVAFLTAPSVPPAEAIPELAAVPPDHRPTFLVASVPTAKALFTLVEKLEAIGCPVRRIPRGPTAPLLAIWLGDPHENPEPLAPVADFFLLGGGWSLLRAVLGELEASGDLARTTRLERLGRMQGVYVPGLFTVTYSEDGTISSVVPRPGFRPPLGLAGGAPFGTELSTLSLRHPRPALARLLGPAADPEAEAARTPEGERVHLRLAVGLTQDEPDAVAAWVKRLRHLLVARWKDARRLPPISVSLICFVPRPWTALQWAPMLTEEALKARLVAVGRELSKVPGVTVTHDLPKWALLGGVLARGDRRAGELLIDAVRVGWERARLAHPLNPAFVLQRERRKEEILPWDHIGWGIDRDALWREYELTRA